MDAITTSHKTFRSVLQRLIDLTSSDLRDLEKQLNTDDPWTLLGQSRERTLTRERCLKLLSVLQEAMETENRRGLKANDNNGDAEDMSRIEKDIAISRSRTSDKIMRLLKEHRLIEVSEFVGYLNQTTDFSHSSHKLATEHVDGGDTNKIKKKAADKRLQKCYAPKRRSKKKFK